MKLVMQHVLVFIAVTLYSFAWALVVCGDRLANAFRRLRDRAP